MQVQIYTIETEHTRDYGGNLYATVENPRELPKIYHLSHLDYVQTYEPIDLPDGYTIGKARGDSDNGQTWVVGKNGEICPMYADRRGRVLYIVSDEGIIKTPLHAILSPDKSPDYMAQAIRAAKIRKSI